MKLLSPPHDALRRRTGMSRPITDRVKESLFSVLYKYDLPDGKIVADLFCGVGSLGLESLSRGAEFVSFVERDLKIIAILEKNIEKAGFTDKSPLGDTLQWKVIRANAFKIGAPVVLRTSYGEEQKYDLIFVDPPYKMTQNIHDNSQLAGLITILSKQTTIGALVVIRTDKRTELLERYTKFESIERRQWGTMAITILQRRSK